MTVAPPVMRGRAQRAYGRAPVRVNLRLLAFCDDHHHKIALLAWQIHIMVAGNPGASAAIYGRDLAVDLLQMQQLLIFDTTDCCR